jgi:polar amino acid transport system substrate-binding protein
MARVRQAHVRLVLIALIALTVLGGCGIPSDPEGTLDRVQGGSMRVGIAENPPWTRLSAERPEGVEVELIEGLAAALRAEIEWIAGSPSDLLKALEAGELDVVVAGLTVDDPWAQVVTFTQPYAEISTVVGVPPGRLSLRSIDGVEVSTERGRATASLVRDAGGVPVPIDDLSRAAGPVAAQEWQIEALDLVRTELELDSAQHAMAVPLGENAWLVRVERFLSARAASVDELLQEQALA